MAAGVTLAYREHHGKITYLLGTSRCSCFRPTVRRLPATCLFPIGTLSVRSSRRSNVPARLCTGGQLRQRQRLQPDLGSHRCRHRAARVGVACVLVCEAAAARYRADEEIAARSKRARPPTYAASSRTLGVFVIIIFFILLAPPADGGSGRRGRSIFFLVGALFSALTGFVVMTLCTRGNVRSRPPPARAGRARDAHLVPDRRRGRMFTVGLGLFGAAVVVLIYRENAPNVLEGFGFGAALLALFMRVGGGIYTKAADVGRGPGGARSSRASPRTTRGTRPRSPTTWATTWATAPAWPRTCSSPTRSCWSPR